MRTYVATPADRQRDWLLVDAANKTLGRLASRVAQLLRGKNNVRFVTHMDTGDHVIVVNAEKIVISGNKAQQKLYYRHSGYPGGLKVTTYTQLLKSRPERVIEHAVKGMLPKKALGRTMYRKLRVYKGPNHPHAGQLPRGRQTPILWRRPCG